MKPLKTGSSASRRGRTIAIAGASAIALLAPFVTATAASAADPVAPKVSVEFSADEVVNTVGSVANFTVKIDNSATGTAALTDLSGVLTVTLPAGVQCGADTTTPALGKLGVPPDAAPFTQPAGGTTTEAGNVCSFNVAVADIAAEDPASSADYTLTSVGANPSGPAFTGTIKAEFKLTSAPGGQFAASWSGSDTTNLVAPYAAQFVAGAVPAPVIGKKYSYQIVNPLGLPAADYEVFAATPVSPATNPVTYNIANVTAEVDGTVKLGSQLVFDPATGKITSSGAVVTDPDSPIYTIVANASSVVYAGASGVPSTAPVLNTASGDFASVQFSAAALFSDVAANANFAEEIYELADNGIIDGYSDGSFKPLANVSRQAFAAFAAKTYNDLGGSAPVGICKAATGLSVFPDVPNNSPFCAEINWMRDADITTGYSDGTFRPTAPITRQAAAAFFQRLDGLSVFSSASVAGTANGFNDVPATHPFVDEIDWLATNKITTGYADGGFHPTANVSRQAAAAFFFRAAYGPDAIW